MLDVLSRKFNLVALFATVLLALHGVFPEVALASELRFDEAISPLPQLLGVRAAIPTFPLGGLVAAAVDVPVVEEVATDTTEVTEKAEAKALKEAEKAAKKAAKAEAKQLEAEQEAVEAAAKDAEKAAKKAAKAEAKAAKKAAKAATAEQAISPAFTGSQVADATAPAPESFATLTPEQKKQFFMDKKAVFKPTPEAIADKVSTGMKMKGTSMPPGVSEKISAKMKGKESFIPTPEAISKKISDGMKMAKSKIEDMVDD